MEDHKILLVHGSEHTLNVVSKGVDRHRKGLPLLSESVCTEREHDRRETCISLLPSGERTATQLPPLTEAAHAFLAQYISPAVLEVFPEWQGVLMKFPAREEAIWVVRDPQTGHLLAQATGQPTVCLEEILSQQGNITHETLVSHSQGGETEAKNGRNKSQRSGHAVTAELTARQQEAIVALLTCASVQAAASRVQIGRTTLYRWLKDKTFLTAYQEARRQATTWSPGRLQQLTEKAVYALEHILDDREAPAPARVSAARTVLEFTSPGKKLHPEDNSLEKVKSRLTSKEFSLDQTATKEGCHHEEDTKDLVERSAGAATTQ